MTLKITLNVALLFFTFQLNAQNDSNDNGEKKSHNDLILDSLFYRLHHETTDTSKINLLNAISRQFVPDQYDKRMRFGDSALALAINIKWDKGQAEALNNIGDALGFIGNVKESLEKHKNALVIFENINDKNGVAYSLGKIGIAYFKVSDFPKSFDYFDRALKIYQELNDKFGVAKNLSYIAILYGTFEKYEKSLEYFKKSLEITKLFGDKYKTAMQLGNIGLTYWKLKDYKQALIYYKNALKLFREIEDSYNYSLFSGNIGLVCADLKNYSEARFYYEKALNHSIGSKDEYGIAYQYGNIGNLNFKMAIDSNLATTTNERQATLSKSIEYLNKAVEKFESLGIKDEQKTFLFSLSNAYKEKGDYKNALETFVSARELQDSIYSADNKKMIAELEIKQQLDIKEKEIEILSGEKEYKDIVSKFFTVLAFFFVIISIAIFLFYLKKRKDNFVLRENIRIRKEIEEALRTNESELKKYQDHLEKLVKMRTEKFEKEISERMRAEEELIIAKERAETVSKAKSIFLANMSHELRTPLVGILGYSDMLSKDIENPEQKDMAKGINRTGLRLLNTLSMVLDLARVESYKYEIKIDPVDVIPILKETCYNFQGAFSLKGLDFNLKLHTESFLVNLDIEMFKVILDNLINNAVKFTDEGEINIETGEKRCDKKSRMFIKICDTGIGIDEKEIPFIFEEFRQLSEGTTKEYPGTGLGLSITKKYIELLNGEITVESKLGAGSIFTVWFNV